MGIIDTFTQLLDRVASNFKLVVLLLLITTFLSYGLTLQMYFWKDDAALMVKAMHPQDPVGFFGPGIKGDGAYRFISVPFTYLYPIFKLNPTPYFFVGIILYFFASLSAYFLALIIYQNKLKAFLVGLIFASGYIGADSIYGLTNSYQTSWTIILLSLSIVFFVTFFRKKNIFLYLLSIILFYISLDTGFIRAHGFGLILFATSFLVIRKINPFEIVKFSILFLPFFYIFRKFYLISSTATDSSNRIINVLLNKDLSFFYNPLLTFSNVIFPNLLMERFVTFVLNITGRVINLESLFLRLIIFFFIVLLAILCFYFFKEKQINSKKLSLDLRVLGFSLTSIIGSFFGVFYIGAATTYLNSTHRYLVTTLLILGFFWVSFFSILNYYFFKKNHRLYLIPILVVIFLNLILVNLFSLENIYIRSGPQRKFAAQLKSYIPNLKEKSFFYFDVSNQNNSAGKFGNIFGAGSVGGLPEISMLYDIDRYQVVASFSAFDDFIQKYKKEKGSILNSYAFYYDNENLIDLTSKFRQLLDKGDTINFNLEDMGLSGVDNFQIKSEIKTKDVFKINNNELFFNFPSNSSFTNSKLKFKLKIDPLDLSALNFPKLVTQNQDPKNDKKLYLEYLIARNQYYKEASASAFDYFQNNFPANLVDQKIETTWMAGRGSWHNIIHNVTDQVMYIDITLNEPKFIGGIIFTNGHKLRTPTKYKIYTFSNKNFELVKEQKLDSKDSNEKWFEKIPPRPTSKVRVEITDSTSKDAPQLAEVELVEERFTNLEFNKADKIANDITLFIDSPANYELVKSYFGQNGKIAFAYYSNKDTSFVNPPIYINMKGLNQEYEYELDIPANGIRLLKGKFYQLNLPATYTFSDFRLISPSLDYYLKNEN